MISHHYQIKLSFLCILATVVIIFWGLIPLTNSLLLFIFIAGCYSLSCQQSRIKIKYISLWAITLALGFFIAISRPDQFEYPAIWYFGSLYEGADNYTLYFNTSKALGGIIVVIWMLNHTTVQTSKTHALNTCLYVITATLFIFVSAKLLLGLQWKPKLPQGLFYFALINLCATVLSEEAFFRLLIQQKLSEYFSHTRNGKLIGLVATSILFAFAHTTSINTLWAMYLLAGLGYGLVFLLTRRFFAAVSVHFLVNLLHFLLLEYPLTQA